MFFYKSSSIGVVHVCGVIQDTFVLKKQMYIISDKHTSTSQANERLYVCFFFHKDILSQIGLFLF